MTQVYTTFLIYYICSTMKWDAKRTIGQYIYTLYYGNPIQNVNENSVYMHKNDIALLWIFVILINIWLFMVEDTLKTIECKQFTCNKQNK